MSQLKNIATICGLERAGMKQTNTEIVGEYDNKGYFRQEIDPNDTQIIHN